MSDPPRTAKKAVLRPSRVREIAASWVRGSFADRDSAAQCMAELESVDAKAAQRARGLEQDPEFQALSTPSEDVVAEEVVAAITDYILGRVKDVAFEITGGLETDADVTAFAQGGELTLESAKEKLAEFVWLPGNPHSPDYAFALLWAAHAKVASILPRCFYMGLEGGPSSGKTRFMCLLLYLVGGEFVSDASEAYLSRILAEGAILGFDELDDQLKAHREGMLESLIRQGTDPRASRRVMEWVGGKDEGEWTPKSLPLYGPKVFTTHDDPATALLTRTYMVHMERHDDVELIVNNLYMEERAAPVRVWLEQRAKLALEGWNTDRVRELMSSPEFKDRLSRLVVSLPRDREIAALMYATAEVFGWAREFEQAIGDQMKAQSEDRGTEEEAEVREALLRTYEVQAAKLDAHATTWSASVLDAINLDRRNRGMRGLSEQAFGRILKSLGARDKVEIRKVRTQHGKRELVFTSEFVQALRGTPPGEPVQSVKPVQASIWSGAPDTPDAPDSGGGEGQDPDFMLAFERARDIRTYAPDRPAAFIARDLEKELRAKGREPNLERLEAGAKAGLQGGP